MQDLPRNRCPEKLQTFDLEVHEDDRDLPLAGLLGVPEERPIAVSECVLDLGRLFSYSII